MGDLCAHCAALLPNRSSYSAIEMVAAAVEDRRHLEAENGRLRVALKEIADDEGKDQCDAVGYLRRIAREALAETSEPQRVCPGDHATHVLGNLIWIECDGDTIARRIFPLPARHNERWEWVEAELAAHCRPDDTRTTGAER